ncbi:MAG TPA: FAD-dependent thymidylate synthase, partial [Vampirovibrionales bacterium]
QASVEGGFTEQENAQIKDEYQKAIDNSYTSYQKLLEAGVCREQARGVLPQATYTQFYWTCNLRSLFHFVKLRDHEGAQWEIRQYAKAMLKQAKEFFPETIEIWEGLK